MAFHGVAKYDKLDILHLSLPVLAALWYQIKFNNNIANIKLSKIEI